MSQLPRLREDLGITPLEGEVIVFDPSTTQAHCFNALGAKVFLACQQGLSFEQLEAECTPSEVEGVLAEFSNLGLLKPEATESEDSGDVSRRRFLEAVGAGVASVVVASVAAPRPAAAASCVNCRRVALFGSPCECSTCGLQCASGATNCSGPGSGPCAVGSPVCCFEYRRNPVNDAAANPCLTEGTGVYDCRIQPNFAVDCNTARNLVAANQNYYCCSCSGAPTELTC